MRPLRLYIMERGDRPRIGAVCGHGWSRETTDWEDLRREVAGP